MASGHSSRKFSFVWAACAAAALVVLTLVPMRLLDTVNAALLNEEVFSSAAMHHQWTDVGASDIRYSKSGKVGIGTNPLEKLHVHAAPNDNVFAAIFGWNEREVGVDGFSTAGLGAGVRGISRGTIGWGVIAAATAETGSTRGVEGITFSRTFQTAGVRGWAVAEEGPTTGVYGVSDSNAGSGVVGIASYIGDATTYGGRFDSHSRGGFGVYARATAPNDPGIGVVGHCDSVLGAGVFGVVTHQHFAAHTYGVVGQTTSVSPNSRGVMGLATPPAVAVYSGGDIVASGAKAFEIDHPLDPANKWLRNYATEAPEPLNAYSGNVVLDPNGAAWVMLPEWFESINRDFRYQLTSIGAPGPKLHVARKIAGNAFLIAGGVPGAEVSWRIEAVRDDLYVRQYGAPVEIEKPAGARGLYLHPELYGQPPQRGLHYRRIEHAEPERGHDGAAALRLLAGPDVRADN